MSTLESQALRDGIRDGSIRCRRPSEGGRCNPRDAEHEAGCVWNRAIIRIYELERAAEGIDPPHDQVVDWPALLDELRKKGFTLDTIADHIGLSQQALSDYRRDVSTPLYAKGEKLVEFWLHATSKPRSEIPRRQALPSAAAFR